MKIKKFFLFACLFPLFTSCVHEVVHDSFTNKLTYSAVTDANPLKGFMSWGKPNSKNAIPISLEYLPINWDKVMTAENTCDFTYLEEKLTECKDRQHQVVLRFVIDVPEEELHLPKYIAEYESMTFDEYKYGSKGTFKAPDYGNEYFVSQMLYFIKELAKKYDGDPRIASIQTGLMGHWGEQHNYYVRYLDSDNKEHEKIIPLDTFRKFIKTFGDNFQKTKLSVRKPVDNYHKDYPNISYYHDMICSKSDDDYMDKLFENSYANPDSWKTSLFSGEIAPPCQTETAQSFGTGNQSEKKYIQDIEHFHITAALFNHVFYTDNVNIKAAKVAQNKLGYDLYVSNADSKFTNEKLDCTVTIKNIGVAPFYYDWPVQIALYDGTNIIETFDTDWKISKIKSKGQETFNFTKNYNCKKPEGIYLLMRIVNPMEGGIQFSFANKERNTKVSGWLTLGKI